MLALKASQNRNHERSSSMTNPARIIIAATVILLGFSTIAEGGGRFRCRKSCPRELCPIDCPPVDGTHGGMGTVERLATSVVKAALAVNNQQNLDAKTKQALLAEFEFQIGPVARDPVTLSSLLADDFVDRQEIQAFIGGEIKDISNRLRQR